MIRLLLSVSDDKRNWQGESRNEKARFVRKNEDYAPAVPGGFLLQTSAGPQTLRPVAYYAAGPRPVLAMTSCSSATALNHAVVAGYSCHLWAVEFTVTSAIS